VSSREAVPSPEALSSVEALPSSEAPRPCPQQTSALLARAGFVHAFFTREGGVSEGPFASLNCSPDVGDRAEHVTENLGRVAQSLGLSAHQLYVAAQVHGRDVIVLDGSVSPDAVARTAADAIVSSAAATACAVRTADCVPILLADPESGRVAAVHAGWRGLVREVLASAIERMVTLGSRRAALLAAFGPHIGPGAFEVGDEVALELSHASTAVGAIQRTANGKPHVDLARIVEAQLWAAGLERSNIEQVPGCTQRDASRYFSFLHDGQRSGRMLSAIVPRTLAGGTVRGQELHEQVGT
jgi:polyphenol oxidase